MTTDKARKRAVRDRMTKTGESYTAARRHVAASAGVDPPADAAALAGPAPSLDPAPPANPAAPAGPASAYPPAAPGPSAVPVLSTSEAAPPLPPRVAEPEVSEEAIVRATGHGWDHWLAVLDERGVDGFLHRDTAAWLRTELGVDGWWAQTITIGFERARGLRAVYQVGDGFSVGVSKTLAVPLDRLWPAFADEEGRSRWLAPGLLRLRTAQPGRTARFDVTGGPSRVVIGFTVKGDAKTSVAVQHERLGSAEEVEERRAFWRERLAALGELLVAAPAASAASPGRGPATVAGPGLATVPGPAAALGPSTAPAATSPASKASRTADVHGADAAGPLDEYLAGVDLAAVPLVIELDRLVRASAPELGSAVKYRMLTYAIGGDWWRWVAAISTTKQAVNLRLLYGTRLRSGAGILRPGSSHLANLDVPRGGTLDAGLVTRLVREAADRHAEFLAAERAARG